MIRDKLIRWLGGYTKSDALKVGKREFEDYSESRRLGGLLPVGAELEITGNGIAGSFLVRQYSQSTDNGGTILQTESK